MHSGHRAVPRRLWRLPLVSALVAAAIVAGGTVLAQEPPPTVNTGPRFSNWGPGMAAPAPEGPVPGATVPAPSGRFGAPAPAPNVWGGCNYELRGTWQYSGEEVQPTAFLYSGEVHVTQYGSWLHARETQSETGAVTNYFGPCTGGTIQFDVYQAGHFIGYQNGAISWGPRPGLRASFVWTTFDPTTDQPATGREHWNRQIFY